MGQTFSRKKRRNESFERVLIHPQLLGQITGFLFHTQTANLMVAFPWLSKFQHQVVWVVDPFCSPRKPPAHLLVHHVLPVVLFPYMKMPYLCEGETPPGNFGYVADIWCPYIRHGCRLIFHGNENEFWVSTSMGRTPISSQRWFFSRSLQESDPTEFVHKVLSLLP
jgi:hypothetical protein